MKHDVPCFDCNEAGHKQGKGCGMHNACEKYRDYYAKRREEDKRRKARSMLNVYTTEAIERVKSGKAKNTMKAYRNGGD